MEILGKRHPRQSQELAEDQQPGGQPARSSLAFVGERRERSARETPGPKLSKTTGLDSTLAAITGKFPQPQWAGQDLRFVFPRQLEAGLALVEGFALSSPSQLLEGEQIDKSKHRGDVATSEVGERGHGLTTLVKTMQSSQRKDFSIKMKQQQRLGCATRPVWFSSSTALNTSPPSKGKHS